MTMLTCPFAQSGDSTRVETEGRREEDVRKTSERGA